MAKNKNRSSKKKIKPGLYVEREIWEAFKKKYKNPSFLVQSFMSDLLKNDVSDKTIQIYPSNDLSNVVFWDSKSWNISISNNSFVVTSNMSNNLNSYVSNYTGGEDEH